MISKNRFVMATVLVAALSIGATAMAGSGGEGKRGDRAAKMEKMKELRGKMLREKVGLSEDRAVQVEQILEANRAQTRALRENVREQMRAVRELIKADSNDQPAYSAALAALTQARAEMHALETAQIEQLSRVLSPKEQAIMMMTMKRVKGHMGRRGGKHGKHFRGKRGDRDGKGDAERDHGTF